MALIRYSVYNPHPGPLYTHIDVLQSQQGNQRWQIPRNRHMPVLGNVHPIKIEILIFFS